jgi:hypothetical protein
VRIAQQVTGTAATSRVITLTPSGVRGLRDTLGIDPVV